MRRLAWLLALVVAAGACRDESVRIRAPDDGADYNRAALAGLIDTFVAAGRTPTAYRELVLGVDRLRFGFDESTAEVAELNLVLLAWAPLNAVSGQPSQDQVEALAVTVWPTALEVEPGPNERPAEYLLRVCAGPLASACRHIIPEYQGPVLAGVVSQRFTDRVREAVGSCLMCTGDPRYADAVRAFVVANGEATARAHRDQVDGAPARWPVAGPAARPWTAAPLFAIDGQGMATLDGASIVADQRRAAMSAARRGSGGGADVLGVFLGPADRVQTLRAILVDASAAGFTAVALATRNAAYPYELRAYPIATTRGRGVRVPARDVDTIQVLVRSLDAHTTGDVAARI